MDEMTDAAGVLDLNPSLMLGKLDAWADGFVRLIPNILVTLQVLIIVWFMARWLGRFINRSAESRGRANLGAVVGSFAR
jgi:hypothetical protein